MERKFSFFFNQSVTDVCTDFLERGLKYQIVYFNILFKSIFYEISWIASTLLFFPS